MICLPITDCESNYKYGIKIRIFSEIFKIASVIVLLLDDREFY